MKTATPTLASAMRILARQIQSPDGVANAAIAEAAERLDELHINTATLQYVNGLAAGDLPMVGDLVMLVARLARKLLKATPADELPSQALDYLNRNGLNGSPLREVGAGDTAVQGGSAFPPSV